MRLSYLIAAMTLLVSFAAAHAAGPVWTVRDIDTFQDNFSSDGTIFGAVRADMAADILPASSPGILPGDSSVVVVTDPVFGLATDGILGGKAVYCYALVYPLGQATKTGPGLSGGTRWPFAGTAVIDGMTWTKLRFDQSDIGGGPVPDNFCIDLNDNLFTPGDTVFFFYAARSSDGPGTTTYFSLEFGATADINVAAALPMEFTCLPAGGFNRGGDILFVDGAEGTDTQVYFEFVLRQLDGLSLVDRYDVRGPVDGVNNRLAGRVVDVVAQLNASYHLLYWDCADFGVTLGDGSGTWQKTDDYGLLNAFLDNTSSNSTVLLFGDDIGEQLNASTSPSATVFKQTYMPFVLMSGNHSPQFGAAPTTVHWPGRSFSDDFAVYGGGPAFNDFDVFQASGTSRLEMTYGPVAATNGAVIGNKNGPTGVLLAGFGLASVRDNETDGVLDRARFWKAASRYNGVGFLNPPVGVGREPQTTLAQNYPNPFNPQTMIAFSIKERAHVSLQVYNVAGQVVRTLANEVRASGAHSVTWDGRDGNGTPVSSGVYFYRLVAGEFTQTKKMVLLK